MFKLAILFIVVVISDCIAVSVTVDTHQCKVSSDMKTLQVVNVVEETNSHYSVSDFYFFLF